MVSFFTSVLLFTGIYLTVTHLRDILGAVETWHKKKEKEVAAAQKEYDIKVKEWEEECKNIIEDRKKRGLEL